MTRMIGPGEKTYRGNPVSGEWGESGRTIRWDQLREGDMFFLDHKGDYADPKGTGLPKDEEHGIDHVYVISDLMDSGENLNPPDHILSYGNYWSYTGGRMFKSVEATGRHYVTIMPVGSTEDPTFYAPDEWEADIENIKFPSLIEFLAVDKGGAYPPSWDDLSFKDPNPLRWPGSLNEADPIHPNLGPSISNVSPSWKKEIVFVGRWPDVNK